MSFSVPPVADPLGGWGVVLRGPCPSGPVKIRHKNDGRGRIDFVFLPPHPAAGSATDLTVISLL